ncbi:MAG TPA: hypothetical protein VGO21_04530 [Candidatus Paceibacterota bacterium]|nr:hypothetical protein [Candidatus Paceibacterota bacterium]
MATLLEDIKTQSDWIVKAFKSDNLNLDYTVHSFIEIDKFISLHVKNGRPVPGGRLSNNFGPILFSIGSYVGETFIRTVPGSVWVTNDDDPLGEINAELKIADGMTVWPIQRIMKRAENGAEDSVYVYGHRLTEKLTNEPFDPDYWKIHQENSSSPAKPWWKFWK